VKYPTNPVGSHEAKISSHPVIDLVPVDDRVMYFWVNIDYVESQNMCQGWGIMSWWDTVREEKELLADLLMLNRGLLLIVK
jgi:hypothetical protein